MQIAGEEDEFQGILLWSCHPTPGESRVLLIRFDRELRAFELATDAPGRTVLEIDLP